MSVSVGAGVVAAVEASFLPGVFSVGAIATSPCIEVLSRGAINGARSVSAALDDLYRTELQAGSSIWPVSVLICGYAGRAS